MSLPTEDNAEHDADDAGRKRRLGHLHEAHAVRDDSRRHNLALISRAHLSIGDDGRQAESKNHEPVEDAINP